MLRSLESINKMVGRNTSILLRTDAAPFRVLVDGPTSTLPGAVPPAAQIPALPGAITPTAQAPAPQ
jgi:hypothetical protein